MPRAGLAAAVVFAVVSAVHALCPISTSHDSRWTVPVVISLLERGDINLDEYLPELEAAQFYAVERVDGHYYNVYPLGGPLIAAPLVVAVRAVVFTASPVLRPIPVKSPVLSGFLRGDFVRSSALVEVLAASLVVGATAAVLFLIAADSLPLAWASLVAFAFAFATSAWSTGSRAFWQHTPSMLLLAITLWVAVRAVRNPPWIAYAAVPLAWSYWVRPTNAVIIAAFTVYVAVCYRRYFLRYCVFAVPIAVAFAAVNWGTYGHVLPPYYRTQPPPAGLDDAIEALAGIFVSPSRGLLVYSPWVVFALWGAVAAVRGRWMGRLSVLGVSAIVLHTLVFAVYARYWHGGHAYGPRHFTDLAPLFALFLIPAIQMWRRSHNRAVAGVFAVLLCFSVWVHWRGATSAEALQWNVDPANVDVALERLWDWRDPQFLRGL